MPVPDPVPDRFLLGEAVVVPRHRTIRVGDREARVEFLAMQVLLVLVGRVGTVVTKDEILAAVWNDRFVGPEVVTVAISQLRKALGDTPREPVFIETIPRVGYRLLSPVEVTSDAPRATPDGGASPVPPPEENGAPAAQRQPAGWRRLVVGAALALALVVVGWRWLPQPAPSVGVAIQVDAFQNLTGDATLDPMTADLRDGLLTVLSREPRIRAFEPGSAPGDGHLPFRLSGSLRGDRGRVRVMLHATDLRSREILWSKAFTGSDVEALTEDISYSFRKGALPRLLDARD